MGRDLDPREIKEALRRFFGVTVTQFSVVTGLDEDGEGATD